MIHLMNKMNHLIWAGLKNIKKTYFINSNPSFLFLVCGDGYSFCESNPSEESINEDFNLLGNIYLLKNKHNADNNGKIIFGDYLFNFDIECEEYNNM